MVRVCATCGNQMVMKEAQTRSADEAATVWYECATCIVDISRSDWSDVRVRSKLPVPIEHHSHAPQGTELALKSVVISIPLADEFVPFCDPKVMGMCKGRLVEYNDLPPRAATVYEVIDTVPLLPRVKYIRQIETYYEDTTHISPTLLVQAKRIKEYPDDYAVYQNALEKVHEFRHYHMEGNRFVYSVYMTIIRSGYRVSCEALLGKQVARTIKTLSSRAVDSDRSIEQRVTDRRGLYVMKIDGVREWWIRLGPWWFTYNPYKPQENVLLLVHPDAPEPHLDRLPSYTTEPSSVWDHGYILDVERVDHTDESKTSIYLIDVLRYDDGTLVSEIRSAEEIRDACTTAYNSSKADLENMLVVSMNKGLGHITVHLRDYHRTLNDALEQFNTFGERADGVVAVISGMEQYKLKEIRTVDLVVHGAGSDRYVSARDGVKIDWASVDPSALDGEVWEYTLHSTGDDVIARPKCHRSDKAIPNDEGAVYMIRALAAGEASGTNVPQVIVSYSMTVRSMIYNKMCADIQSPPLIVDVGSAQGECINIYTSMRKGGIVLLTDVDEKRVEHLRTTYPHVRWCDERDKLLDMLKKISPPPMNSSPVFVSIHHDAAQIVEDILASNRFKQSLVVVSLFSMNYFVEGMLKRRRLKWFKMYGCCYLYDNVRVGGALIDTDEVKMIRTGNRTASVVFRSQSYNEPALTQLDMRLFMPRCNNPVLDYPFKSGTVQAVTHLMQRLCIIT